MSRLLSANLLIGRRNAIVHGTGPYLMTGDESGQIMRRFVT
jgi:hypothetical protein